MPVVVHLNKQDRSSLCKTDFHFAGAIDHEDANVRHPSGSLGLCQRRQIDRIERNASEEVFSSCHAPDNRWS
jgi:hypothetical protein